MRTATCSCAVNRCSQPFLVAALVAVLTLAWGWVLFHRAEFQFAENI